jgi:hypothetical protein
MGRKKDREKAAKRTANQPAWERFSAELQEGRLYRAFFRNIASELPPDQRARGRGTLSMAR